MHVQHFTIKFYRVKPPGKLIKNNRGLSTFLDKFSVCGTICWRNQSIAWPDFLFNSKHEDHPSNGVAVENAR